jgi:VanZ family protein
MKTSRSIALFWSPTLAYMLLIWGLSSIPRTAPVVIVPMQDKVVHLVEYAVLAILYCYSIARTRPMWQKPLVMALSVLLAALWGAVDEWHQSFVPNRSPDVMDAVADALGATIGCATSVGLPKVWPKKSSD